MSEETNMADVTQTTSTIMRMKRRRLSIAARGKRPTRNHLLETEETDIDGQTKEQNERAEKLDGAFFEEYSSLDNIHDDHVNKAQQETLKHESHHYIGPDPYHTTVFKPPPKEKALQLYKELLYTVTYQLGKRKLTADSLTDGEIFSYAREVFNMTNDEHKDLLEQVGSMKSPECYLNVQVISGSNLPPMDANGLSDPYCMMSLIAEGEGAKVSDNGNKVKKKALRYFRTEDEVELTKIKLRTLNPEWKESFKFHVKDIQNQIFRLDLWDKDDDSVILDADNKITAIKGFRGAGRFFKEIYQSATSGKDTLDDFMGLVEIPLKSISTNGINTWFELQPRSNKRKAKGKINLKLVYTAKNPHQVSSVSSSDSSPKEIYKDLLGYFVKYDCEKATQYEPEKEWDCVLSETAQYIIDLYTTQHEIGNLEQTVFKWKIYSSLINDAPIQIEVMYKLLDDYREHSVLSELQSQKEKDEFVASLQSFVEYSMQLVLKYRYVFSASRQSRCILFGKYLLCLLIIYKIPLYKQKYPDKWLGKDLEEAVKKSTQEWFYVMEAYHQTSYRDDTLNNLQQMVNLTNTILADLKTGQDNYKPIFDLVKVQYMSIVFNKVELLLAEMLQNETLKLQKELRLDTKESQELGTNMFELYLAVKHLHKLKGSLPEEEKEEGGIDAYHKWFLEGVMKWLEIAATKASERTTKALELDEVRVIDSMVKYSSSAVDVTTCLGKICMLWKTLDWPEATSGFLILTQITGLVGTAATDYARSIFDQLKEKGFYDDVGQFDVTDQLCIQMNNLAHVLEFLDNYVPTVLHYDVTIDAMVQVHGETHRGKLSSTLLRILQSSKEDIQRQLDHIIEQIELRMKESVTDFLIKIVSYTDNDIHRACAPLLDYIDSNLETLFDALLTQVFERMLLKSWEMFISCMNHLLKKNEKMLGQKHYARFSNVLEIVRCFFHGDGQGLSSEALDIEAYKNICNVLKLNKATTEFLIQTFYRDRCKEQLALETSKFGMLTFKAFYSNERLNVMVMSCRNLLPMDSSGTSDPYVVLEIVPSFLFPNQKKMKTSIQKNTLFPLFDETFVFEIPREDCSKEGVTLLFTVFDHDRMTENDIAGEVWYELQYVPGLGVPVTTGGFGTAPQIDMPLMIGELKGEIIDILKKRRSQDNLADTFITKQKRRLQKMADDLKKALGKMNVK